MTSPQSNPKENNLHGYTREENFGHDSAKTMNASGANLVRHLKEDTIEIAGEIVAEGQHKMQDIRSYTTKYLKNMEKEIMEKPVQSIAIAFAAGTILSLLLGRR